MLRAAVRLTRTGGDYKDPDPPQPDHASRRSQGVEADAVTVEVSKLSQSLLKWIEIGTGSAIHSEREHYPIVNVACI